MTSEQARTEVLIVGGGVAALEAALALNERGQGHTRTTLLAPNSEFSYRPVRVGEPFGRPEARNYSLARVAADLGLERKVDTLKWVDATKRLVHTEGGLALTYDVLLLALGARTYPSLAHALTLDPARLDEQLHGVIQDVECGSIRSIAFVIPSVYAWPLPIYELALMAERRAYEMNLSLEVTVVTPEEAPLAIFGGASSDELRRLLDRRGITVLTSSHCVVREPGHLTIYPANRQVVADRVIALPELHGPALPGIPRSAVNGFISADRHGRVEGQERVFAAGDLTDFPIKHGGIAAQQADAAADSIAAFAGADIVPQPFVPTIHGLLWGGDRPLYFRARVTGAHGSASSVTTEPLWTPPAKIHARYLGPYLDALDHAAAAAA
jgi:sulfide:quinone oxidoreductase